MADGQRDPGVTGGAVVVRVQALAMRSLREPLAISGCTLARSAWRFCWVLLTSRSSGSEFLLHGAWRHRSACARGPSGLPVWQLSPSRDLASDRAPRPTKKPLATEILCCYPGAAAHQPVQWPTVGGRVHAQEAGLPESFSFDENLEKEDGVLRVSRWNRKVDVLVADA
jgi:hypothetical protein